MSQSKYDKNFLKAILDPRDIIPIWTINPDAVELWMNLKDASMIFVPCIDEHISRETFFCSICKKWFTIHNSVKNIKRHALIHSGTLQEKVKQKNDFFSENQEKFLIEKMVSFIIFSTQTFQYSNDESLKKISNKLPNRNKITNILEKLAKATRDEIKSTILYSSSNSITFDGWTSKSNIPFFGITIRCLIDDEYKDFFLDLIIIIFFFIFIIIFFFIFIIIIFFFIIIIIIFFIFIAKFDVKFDCL